LNWKQPIIIGDAQTPLDKSTDDFSEYYEREGEFESAELQVQRLPNGNVKVTGLALWGKTLPRGPNIGELDFEAEIKGNRVTFSDGSLGDEEYRLELLFKKDRLIATEKLVGGYFGMNVSFGGEYTRIK